MSYPISVYEVKHSIMLNNIVASELIRIWGFIKQIVIHKSPMTGIASSFHGLSTRNGEHVYSRILR